MFVKCLSSVCQLPKHAQNQQTSKRNATNHSVRFGVGQETRPSQTRRGGRLRFAQVRFRLRRAAKVQSVAAIRRPASLRARPNPSADASIQGQFYLAYNRVVSNAKRAADRCGFLRIGFKIKTVSKTFKRSNYDTLILRRVLAREKSLFFAFSRQFQKCL